MKQDDPAKEGSDVTFGALEASGLGREHTKLTVAERKRMLERDPASRTIGRWEPRQPNGKPKRNVWKQDGANRCYMEHASAEPATPLLDRLQGGSGPARVIMQAGEWGEYGLMGLNISQSKPVVPDMRHLAGIWK